MDEHDPITFDEVDTIDIEGVFSDDAGGDEFCSMVFWVREAEVYDFDAQGDGTLNQRKLNKVVKTMAKRRARAVAEANDGEALCDDADQWGTFQGETYCRLYVHVTLKAAADSEDEEEEDDNDEDQSD